MVVKDPLKVQDRKVDFIITENEKFTDVVPRSTLQLAFEKLPLSFETEEECPQLLAKTIRIIALCPNTHLCEPGFSRMLQPNLSQDVS